MTEIRTLPPAKPAPPTAPGEPLLRPRAASDAALLAELLCDEAGERGRLRLRWAAALRRHGLAALARRPPRRPRGALPIDERARRRLVVALEIGRRAHRGRGPVFERPEDVYAWCGFLRGARQERFVGLYLDARHRLRRRRLISIGTLTASLVHPREVLAPAVAGRSAALVVVHNHPSGDPEPSGEDCALTRRLAEGARLLGVELLDHVVVAAEGFTSLRQRGIL